MSLDVYLEENYCPVCKRAYKVFCSNITHNLNKMADALGIYEPIWRPEECGVEKAEQLIPILEKGVALLELDPEHYKQYDASNGWGTYDGFLPWLREYLEACKKYPKARVRADR